MRTAKRVSAFASAVKLRTFRRFAAKWLNILGIKQWLDDQIYKYDAGLDIKLDGRHPLTIHPVQWG